MHILRCLYTTVSKYCKTLKCNIVYSSIMNIIIQCYINVLFCTLKYIYYITGVADGVGGWRAYGIDPGEFSSYLMRTCERLVRMGHFKMSEPGDLLAKSYYELLEHKKPILGNFTIQLCVILCISTTQIQYYFHCNFF